MNKNLFKSIRCIVLSLIFILFVFGSMPTATLSNGDFSQEHQIRKAKIYEETHDLLSETDLYCSFMVLDEERPLMQIIGAEREYEKEMLSDGDVLYVNQGKNDGLEAGQLYLILDIQDQIPGYGPLAFKQGIGSHREFLWRC